MPAADENGHPRVVNYKLVIVIFFLFNVLYLYYLLMEILELFVRISDRNARPKSHKG